MANSATAKRALQPWISGLYATPTIALAPLFILWLGIGIWSKVLVVIFLVLFPVTINTEAGLRTTSERLIEMLRSFGASPRQIFFKVSLPSAMPFILAGLKLGIGRGLIGVVVAELFGSRAGLGRLISQSADFFNMPELFAGVVVLAFAGIVMTAGFTWLGGQAGALDQGLTPVSKLAICRSGKGIRRACTRCRTSTSRSSAASSSRWSAPPDAARPRSCASSPGSNRRARGRFCSTDARCAAPAATAASCSRATTCCPGARCSPTRSSGARSPAGSAPPSAARTLELLKLVGLEGFEDYHPRQLPGGMRQRVNLARALAIDPEILLMDEPFSSLDAQTREIMQTELMRIWEEGRKTVLFVTHQIDEAVFLSDRVLVFARRPGRLLENVRHRAAAAARARDQAHRRVRALRGSHLAADRGRRARQRDRGEGVIEEKV